MNKLAGCLGAALMSCVILSSCSTGGNQAPQIAVVITNKIATIAPGAAGVTLNAQVFNDASNRGVTFKITVNGSDCQPACGTLTNATSFSVQYDPPSSVPSPPNDKPTITATSAAARGASDSDTITIQAPVSNVAVLNGQYAFLVAGFGNSGFAYAIAGSFTADGAGHITGGEVDVNNDGALGANGSALTGTYTLDGDLRGVISFSNAITQAPNPLAFSYAVDSTGSTGHLISLDNNQFALSGDFQLQQLVAPAAVAAGGPVKEGTVLGPGAPIGDYIFRTISDDPGIDHIALAGRFTVGSSGQFSNGIIDATDIFNGNDLVDASLTGSVLTAPDANGRGTLTMSPAASGTLSFAYYEVSPQKLYVLEIDAGARGVAPVHRGEVRAQTVPFGSGGANGTSAFGLAGGDAADVQIPGSSAAAGQIAINGSSATVTSDLNDVGNVFTNVRSTGTVTFDSGTGRGTISFPNGFNNGFVNSVVFYEESPGKGVMMDTTPLTNTTFGEALVGDLLPQTGTPFGNSSLQGNIMGVTLLSTDPNLPSIVAALTADDTNRSITGLADVGFAAAAAFTNQEIEASYSGINATTGRGQAIVPAELFGFVGGTADASFYLASPDEFFLIGLDSGGLTIESTLGVFDPQGTFTPTARPAAVSDAAVAPWTAVRKQPLQNLDVRKNPHPLGIRHKISQ